MIFFYLANAKMMGPEALDLPLGQELPTEDRDIPLQEYYYEISDELKTVPNTVYGLIPNNNSSNCTPQAMNDKDETSTVSFVLNFVCIETERYSITCISIVIMQATSACAYNCA